MRWLDDNVVALMVQQFGALGPTVHLMATLAIKYSEDEEGANNLFRIGLLALAERGTGIRIQEDDVLLLFPYSGPSFSVT